MLEYEFETVRADLNGGGFIGGQRLETREYWEIILRRAAAAIPAAQKMGNYLESVDLVFEREQPEA